MCPLSPADRTYFDDVARAHREAARRAPLATALSFDIGYFIDGPRGCYLTPAEYEQFSLWRLELDKCGYGSNGDITEDVAQFYRQKLALNVARVDELFNARRRA